MLTKSFLAAVIATVAGAAAAAPVDLLVYEIKDAGTNAIEPDNLWLDDGAVSDANNFKSAWIDSASNWSTVDSVRVSMLSGGNEVAYIAFGGSTSKSDFFTAANVVDSTWGDISTNSFNYFSIPGHDDIGRNWFVNQNYGGCWNDAGYMAVVDYGPSPCGSYWESTANKAPGDPDRMFIYSTGSAAENYTYGSVGFADTFAVTVTYDDGTTPVPLPATGALFAAGLGAFGLLRRKRNAA